MFRVIIEGQVSPLPGDVRRCRVVKDDTNLGQGLAAGIGDVLEFAKTVGPFIGDGARLIATLTIGVVAWDD